MKTVSVPVKDEPTSSGTASLAKTMILHLGRLPTPTNRLPLDPLEIKWSYTDGFT